MKFHFFAAILLVLFGIGSVQSNDFRIKTKNEFPPLSHYKDVEAFERHNKEYIQICLEYTGGGSGSIPCLINYELWDRELNIYYKELSGKLDDAGKKVLKQSQIAWLKERDLSFRLNALLLNKVYKNKKGAEYSLMRAGDADKLMVPLVKQRALYLRNASGILGDP